MSTTKKRNILIFIVLYIAYTAIYAARLNLTVATPSLISEAIANKAQIGVISGVFSLVYACGRMLNGYAADKIQPYIMIGGGLLLTAVGNFVYGLFPPYYALIIAWAINACGQSMLWSSILRVASHIYPKERVKQKTSMLVTSVATGNIAGIVVSTAIINNMSLKFAFLIPSIITFILALAVVATIKSCVCENIEEGEHLSLINLFTQKTILIQIVPAFLHGIIKDNISLWMTVYFVERFSVNLSKSSAFVLFIPLVGLGGRLIYPLLLKLLKNKEHNVSILGFLLCVVFSIPLAIDTSSPIIAVICLSMLYALISVANTTILSIFPMHFANTGNVASVSGIMDFATYCGAAFGSFIYGITITHFGYAPMYASWIIISVVSIVFTKLLINALNK